MSVQSAIQFLSKAAHDLEFQHKFELAHDPKEFLKIANEMGYDFTTEELKEVIKENSEGIKIRRNTGIWPWLRHVNWI